ncbi:uncharacterized protein BO95DRAFT_153898 [Aspergillus brunneoviolaceus CBS 621.78]|uniref:Uncharacterized protein n=1 Tax=Aspergillus brunneoviolaceus CBS 621.78 TaxID=1450534 RepID=A0ACD1G790_9EURO|nr:hypothetical protein BO95DRAFT_153898 [Aspergillus brunneoviolaceus CBS 621.78]RAH45085.1 hypothetical protein BO95DRAFT_153898 [Aspergillus brunneoviolaceus CBS 621.78]
MVNLDVIHASNTTLVKSQPLVAVFFGGNSGIGHYTLRALATAESQHRGKGLRAYLVGRKAPAAETIIAECRTLYPEGEYIFVQAHDLSLLRDVDRVCAEILSLEQEREREREREQGQPSAAPNPRIDYLMLSHGGAPFQPRKDTAEGLDTTMSLLYYSRMRAVTNLLPLLLQSPLPATIVSVYAAGFEGKLYSDDLSLRNLKLYSYTQARSHMIYMHTWFMEQLAERHRGRLRLVHIFPGLVLGPAFANPELPAWFRGFWRWVFVPLLGRWVSVPAKECGTRMLSLASPRYPPRGGGAGGASASEGGHLQNNEDVMMGTDGQLGSGVYSLGWKGESNIQLKAYEKFDLAEMRAKIWEHTIKAFETVERGDVFKD